MLQFIIDINFNYTFKYNSLMPMFKVWVCFAFIRFASFSYPIHHYHSTSMVNSFFILSFFLIVCCLSWALNSVIVFLTYPGTSSIGCLTEHRQILFQWFAVRYSLNTTTGCINPSIQSIIHFAMWFGVMCDLAWWKTNESASIDKFTKVLFHFASSKSSNNWIIDLWCRHNIHQWLMFALFLIRFLFDFVHFCKSEKFECIQIDKLRWLHGWHRDWKQISFDLKNSRPFLFDSLSPHTSTVKITT